MAGAGGISVVLPVSRADPAALRAAVACLRGQTCGRLEILVVLNGAEAGTGRWTQELAKEDDRFRVLELPESNLSAALNAGLAEAEHDLVARMDADDTCAPDRLRRQAGYMREHPAVAALGTAFDR